MSCPGYSRESDIDMSFGVSWSKKEEAQEKGGDGKQDVSTTVPSYVFVLPSVCSGDARDNVDFRTGKKSLLSSFSLLALLLSSDDSIISNF